MYYGLMYGIGLGEILGQGLSHDSLNDGRKYEPVGCAGLVSVLEACFTEKLLYQFMQ